MTDLDARTIVWVSLGIASYVHRIVPVARSAVRQGHRFVLVTADADGAALARRQGVEVVELVDQGARWAGTFPGPHWRRGGRLLHRIPGLAAGPRRAATAAARARRDVLLDTDELLDSVRACAPDVVVTELEQHRDIRALLGADLPLVIVDDHYGTMPGPGAPPAGSAARGGTSARARTRASVAWRALGARFAVERRIEGWWLRGADRASVLEELAAREGLAAHRIVDGGYMYHRYPGVPVLRPVVEGLLLPGDDRSGTICGAVVDDHRAGLPPDSEDQARWERVAAAHRESSQRRLVYASTGTISRQQDAFVSAIVDQLGGRDDLGVVLSIGGDAEQWRAMSLPGNVEVFAQVPQIEVLALADLMIGQGGVGSVHEALWFGVPQVLVPAGGIGQAGLAMRIEAAGLGRCLGKRHLAELGATVDALLTDDATQQRLASMAASMRSVGGADAFVSALLREIPA